MTRVLHIVFVLAALQSCALFGKKSDEAPIAKCGKAYLYPSDILGENYTPEDVANIGEAQINDWIVQQLWYKEAKSKLKEEYSAEREIENLRTAVYVSQYQQQLVESQEINISDEEILTYFKEHKDQFISQYEEFKIQMFILPTDFNNLPQNISQLNDDIISNNLKTYCESHPSKCIQDTKWASKQDLDALGIPDYLQKTSINYEEFLKEDNETILLRILEKRNAGTPMSLELASNKIRQILFFQKSSELIKAKDEELLTNAQKKKNIEIYK